MQTLQEVCVKSDLDELLDYYFLWILRDGWVLLSFKELLLQYFTIHYYVVLFIHLLIFFNNCTDIIGIFLDQLSVFVCLASVNTAHIQVFTVSSSYVISF